MRTAEVVICAFSMLVAAPAFEAAERPAAGGTSTSASHGLSKASHGSTSERKQKNWWWDQSAGASQKGASAGRHGSEKTPARATSRSIETGRKPGDKHGARSEGAAGRGGHGEGSGHARTATYPRMALDWPEAEVGLIALAWPTITLAWPAPAGAGSPEPAPAPPSVISLRWPETPPGPTLTPPPAAPPAAAPKPSAPAISTKPLSAAPPTGASVRDKEEWPGWLQVGAEARGRAEMFTGIGYQRGNQDLYYLHRLRLNAAIQARSWLRLFTQVQDSEALGFNTRPIPNNHADTVDLRQGYLELGNARDTPWGLRVGRQELIFGEERLIGAGNWGNVARTFDAARLSYTRKGARLDWFASSVVAPVNGRFNRLQDGNNLYGFYSSLDNPGHKGVIEPYLLWKTTRLVRAEIGPPGALDVYTYGARASGQLPGRFDYNIEMALQRGRAAGDDLAAWAGHWVLGYPLWDGAEAPRLVAEYNFASGDKNGSDGQRGTFDQLFPTNHSKYGTVDRFGWRNLHDAMAGLEWKPRRKWKFNLDYHSFWLATRRDALYAEAGGAVVRNPNASSNHIGQEVDLQCVYLYSRQLQFGLGYGYLFGGAYLEQSTPGSPASAPYVMWNYKF